MQVETQTRPLTFLIVDDEQVNLMLIEAILKARGVRVIKATNGEQAVSLFLEQPVDMVLMDIMMPGMDGYQATTAIKEHDTNGFTPILFVTAFDDDHRLARCIEAGGDDFITKPISRVQLNAKIDAWLRTRQLYQTVAWQRDALSRHQERLRREQEMAAHLIACTTERATVAIPGLHSHYDPAEILSGDILLSVRRPNGNCVILVGDFTGHGIASAVGVPSLAETFVTEVERGADPSQLLDNINARLHRALPPEMFMTAALVEVNLTRRDVGVWNAGMPPVLVVAEGHVVHSFESTELPLGIVENEALGRRRLQTVPIPEGGWLYASSDGLVEATDSAGHLFGSDTMARVVSEAAPGAGFNDLVAACYAFQHGGETEDDVTVVGLDFDCLLASGPEEGFGHHRAGTWQAELVLDAATLRQVNPVQPVMDLLTSLGAVEEVRQGCYMVVAELFTNALEHGLLQLDSGMKMDPTGFEGYYREREAALARLQSGSVRIRVNYTPEEQCSVVEFEVEDSGEGFDFGHHETLGDSALGANPMASGRGIAFIQALCDEVTYFPPGNRVRARYVWSADNPS